MAGNKDYEDKEVNDFDPWLKKSSCVKQFGSLILSNMIKKKTVFSVKLKSSEYAFGNSFYKVDFKDVKSFTV